MTLFSPTRSQINSRKGLGVETALFILTGTGHVSLGRFPGHGANVVVGKVVEVGTVVEVEVFEDAEDNEEGSGVAHMLDIANMTVLLNREAVHRKSVQSVTLLSTSEHVQKPF